MNSVGAGRLFVVRHSRGSTSQTLLWVVVLLVLAVRTDKSRILPVSTNFPDPASTDGCAYSMLTEDIIRKILISLPGLNVESPNVVSQLSLLLLLTTPPCTPATADAAAYTQCTRVRNSCMYESHETIQCRACSTAMHCLPCSVSAPCMHLGDTKRGDAPIPAADRTAPSASPA